MPSKKVPCPQCGNPKGARAALCGACGKGKYERTDEIRRLSSQSMTGKERLYARGVKRPEVAKKIAAAWTPAMREAARIRGLESANDPDWRRRVGMAGTRNPNYQGKGTSEYGAGFSRGMKKRLLDARGRACEDCGATGRLDIHHRDFAKVDHSEANLLVVCRSCHKIRHFANSANT